MVRAAAAPAAPKERLWATLLTALAIGGMAFLYRYLSFVDFPNDHYLHLAKAQQMLFGAWPVRDFVDSGLPLQSALSAVAQIVGRPGLHTEVVLIAIMFAVAAALSCVGAVWLSGSVVAGAIAAVASVLVYPVGYSYPKLLAYAAGLVALSIYARRPTRFRLVAVAAVIAAAFLLRHDHAVILGAGVCVAMLVCHGTWREAGSALAGLALVTALLTAPYLLWIHVHDGLGQYLADGAAFSRREAERASWAAPAFSFDWSRPMVARDELRPNAVTLLFYLVWLLPALAVGVLAVAWRTLTRPARATAIMAIVLQGLMNTTMLRDPLDNRIRDVVAPAVVLLAFVATWPWRPAAPRRGRWTLRAAAVLLVAGTLGITSVVGDARERLVTAGLRDGLIGVERRARRVRRMFAPPHQRTGRVSTQYESLVAYLGTCTPPGARIFTVMFAPELFFYTGRGFAGGHASITQGYYADDRHVAMTIDRLSREDVPFVVLDAETRGEMVRDFPRVMAYVAGRYHEVARFAMSEDRVLIVLAETARRVAGMHRDSRLPCFAAGRPAGTHGGRT